MWPRFQSAMKVRTVCSPLEVCGDARGRRSVDDGDRLDHQGDTPLAGGSSHGGGDKVAQLAVDVPSFGRTVGRRQSSIDAGSV